MVSRILTPAEATAIQKALNDHGASLIVDGHFGELSKLALIRFQHAHPPLSETGNPDPDALAALGIPDLFKPNRKDFPMNNILGTIWTGLFAHLLNWQLLQGYIRTALITVGGWIGLDGLVGAEGSKAIIGALLVIVGVIFDAISNNTKRKALAVVKAADASPDVAVIPAHETATGKPIVTAAK